MNFGDAIYSRKLALLKLLCDRAGCYDKLQEIEAEMVLEDMNDGGMGSFAIIHPKVQAVEYTLIEADYIDEDGVDAFIVLLVDLNRFPSEVDIFKVDFSRMVEYPTANKVFNIR